MMQLLAVIVVLLFVYAMISVAERYAEARFKALTVLAEANSFIFSKTGPDPVWLRQTGQPLFESGDFRSAENLMRVGSRLGELLFFDYTYLYQGRRGKTHNFTIGFIPAGKTPVPQFVLSPVGIGNIGGWLSSAGSVDMAHAPEFNDRYHLVGPDELAIKAFFTPKLVSWLGARTGLNIHGAPGGLIIFKGDEILKPEQWYPFMEEVRIMAEEVL